MALQYDQTKKQMKTADDTAKTTSTTKPKTTTATGTASKPIVVDTGVRNASTQGAALTTGTKAFTSNTPMLYEGSSVKPQTTQTTPKTTTAVAPVQTVATTVSDNTPTIAQMTPSTTQSIVPTSSVSTSIPAYTSTAEKPTFSSNATKPTYESSSSASSYTPQTYEAASYSGMGFSGRSYKGTTFEPSQEYYEAWEETKRMLEELKDGRTSYSDKVDAKLEEIENKPKFQYDFNKDPLFQNMLASYMRSGQVAMQNTMGQAAALTGGYGSSYATSAANQAYNSFVQEAYSNLPEYYQMAFNEYQAELENAYNLLDEYRASDQTEYARKQTAYQNQNQLTEQLYNRELSKAEFDEQSRQWAAALTESSAQHAESLSAQTAMHAQSLTESSRQWAAEMNQNEQRYAQQLALQQEQMEYDRYRDAMSDYYRDISFEYDKYRDELSDYYNNRNFDYGVYRDTVSDIKYENERAYQRERDSVSDAKWLADYNRSIYESDRAYDRNVYESDRDYGLSAAKYASSLSQWEQEFNYQKEQDIERAKASAKASANSTPTYKDMTDTAKKTIESALDSAGGVNEKFFNSIADMYDTYGQAAVDRAIDAAVAKKESARILNRENGKLTNGYGKEISLNLAGNPAAVKSATFTDQGNGKYYCQQTGEIVTLGDLIAMYGNNYTSHIKGAR